MMTMIVTILLLHYALSNALKTNTYASISLLTENYYCRFYNIYFSGDFVLWKIGTLYTFVEVRFNLLFDFYFVLTINAILPL